MVIVVEKIWVIVNFGGVKWKCCIVYILFFRYLEKVKGEKIFGFVGGKFFYCY